MFSDCKTQNLIFFKASFRVCSNLSGQVGSSPPPPPAPAPVPAPPPPVQGHCEGGGGWGWEVGVGGGNPVREEKRAQKTIEELFPLFVNVEWKRFKQVTCLVKGHMTTWWPSQKQLASNSLNSGARLLSLPVSGYGLSARNQMWNCVFQSLATLAPSLVRLSAIAAVFEI